MPKPKACKICKLIHEEDACPKCGSSEKTEGFKGKIIVLNPEKSEVAKKIDIHEKGEFAIKTR